MGKHTEAVVRAAAKRFVRPVGKLKKLQALRAEVDKMLERCSFFLRRAEALNQQALVMTITSQEIAADRSNMEQKVAETAAQIDRLIDEIGDARTNRRPSLRGRPRTAKRPRGRSR